MAAPGSVESIRGEVVEIRHRVHAVVADAEGRIVASAGDPGLVTYLRSAAKPFQALPALRLGARPSFGLADEHVAVASASHRGTPAHVGAVAGLLERAGVPQDALRVHGLHPPLDPQAAAALAGRPPSPLQHNCSGNHAISLAHARLAGAPLEGYLDPRGPTQESAHAAVAASFGREPAHGLDHCGMGAYALPLATIAAGYARLALGRLPEPWNAPGLDVVGAMRAAPEMVAGDGQLDTLALALDGVVCKSGAAGIVCCGSSRTGLGGVLKVEDGAALAATLAGTLLVEAVAGATSRPLEALRQQPLVDGAGEPVGRYRVELTLG